MSLTKSRVQTFVLLASLRNCVMAGHYSTRMVSKDEALPGREKAMDWTQDNDARHYVNKNRLLPPFPDGMELAMFGMGCFWGAERKFWQKNGVYSTQVGYSSGFTKNPTYKEVCGGKTNHNEVVRVVYHPSDVSYLDLLKIFWENHDPTQGMRQGNDTGTQYRSGIYFYDNKQKEQAQSSRKLYEQELLLKGFGKITTEIEEVSEFYYAEDYHQQYLAKNPGGYCGLGGTGVTCPIGLGPKAEL